MVRFFVRDFLYLKSDGSFGRTIITQSINVCQEACTTVDTLIHFLAGTVPLQVPLRHEYCGKKTKKKTKQDVSIVTYSGGPKINRMQRFNARMNVSSGLSRDRGQCPGKMPLF